LYGTRKPGGEVRQLLHGFISVVYAIFAKKHVGWILKYQPVPESWPE
jgi:hypothetical protein